jgi:hypothetical protein
VSAGYVVARLQISVYPELGVALLVYSKNDLSSSSVKL